MYLFINTSLNYNSIRSYLVSQSSNKLILNNEQIFNATDLFGIILFQIHAVKI